jgi:hypothetical protein
MWRVKSDLSGPASGQDSALESQLAELVRYRLLRLALLLQVPLGVDRVHHRDDGIQARHHRRQVLEECLRHRIRYGKTSRLDDDAIQPTGLFLAEPELLDDRCEVGPDGAAEATWHATPHSIQTQRTCIAASSVRAQRAWRDGSTVVKLKYVIVCLKVARSQQVIDTDLRQPRTSALLRSSGVAQGKIRVAPRQIHSG